MNAEETLNIVRLLSEGAATVDGPSAVNDIIRRVSDAARARMTRYHGVDRGAVPKGKIIRLPTTWRSAVRLTAVSDDDLAA